MNAIVKTTPAPLPQPTANALVPSDMGSAIRLAEMMSSGRLVPQHLQKSPGDCLMVVEQAVRWGMSPFAVAQSTSVIQGKLMFEGKLVAAALHSSGILATRLDYEFSGEGDTRAVTVRATLRGEASPREVVVTFREARTSNGMWTKQPDQQLVYAGTRVWARRHAPEVMLGVYSPEEFEAPAPREAAPSRAPTIEAEPARPVQDVEPEHTGPEYPFATRQGGQIFNTGSEWIARWRALADQCAKAGILDKLASAREMNRGAFEAIRDFDPQAVLDVDAILDAALASEVPA